MNRILREFASDESGATAVEYGAIVICIGLVLALTLEAIGLSLAGAFSQIKTIFGAATPN